MTVEAPMRPDRSPKSSGLRHLRDAGGYSLSGLRVLLGEAAFRQEILLALGLFALLALAQAPLVAFLWQSVLLLVLVAFEAINTAIELVVDRLSPEWSDFARRAKDLGSFAVSCLVIANLMHAAAGLWAALA